MDLTERLVRTLRHIYDSADLRQIDLNDAEHLCNLRLVEADAGTNYRVTTKGREVLNGYRWPD
jgi:uncharacterized protein YjhX (UPF0386 family)